MTAPRTAREAILQLAATRAASFCPSEAARLLADDWRPLMPAIRAEAARLLAEGRIVVTQSGRPVDPETAIGPIRLSARPDR